MTKAPLTDVLHFCAALDQRGLRYTLTIARLEALMVEIVAPGQRGEVEFFGDGDIDVQRFISEGVDDLSRPVEEILQLLADFD